MIGGGVLSLPFAVSRSGLLIGFICLFISAISSVFSFDILVSASRRTGAMTYQQIAGYAYGPYASISMSAMILTMTLTASVGYCILVGDLMKPIVCYMGSISDTECGQEWLRRLVITVGILCVSPFCYMRQMGALKYTSLLSICSVLVLAAIITGYTLKNFGAGHDIFFINNNGESIKYFMQNQVKLLPETWEDVIYVIPVFGLSFMCHFNIPQVHSELTRPTRKRMRGILYAVVCACSVLYSVVAFFGYFYSFGYTCGNILLNYDQKDPIVTVARLCLGFVILFTYPLLLLPARASLHNLLNLCCKFKSMNLVVHGPIAVATEDLRTTDFANDNDKKSDGLEVNLLVDNSSSDDDGNTGDMSDMDIGDNALLGDDIDDAAQIKSPVRGNIQVITNQRQSIDGASALQQGMYNSLLSDDGNVTNKSPERPIKKPSPIITVKKTNDKSKNDVKDSNKIKKIAVINKATSASYSQLKQYKTRTTRNSNKIINSLSVNNRYNKKRQKTQNVYAASSSALLNRQFRKVPLSYNTFNAKTINKKYATNLRSPMHSDDESYEASVSRTFTTRSVSHMNSPLRGPQDALMVVNTEEDLKHMRTMDFGQRFGDLESAQHFDPSRIWLIAETTVMIALSMFIAFLTSSVMVVWGLCGSTVTIAIAFTLPGIFFFKIRFKRKGWTVRTVCALILFGVSFLAIIICTWQALTRLDALPCPDQPPQN